MDKRKTENDMLDLSTQGEPDTEDLEEAFHILRSLPVGPDRDVTVANVVAVTRDALRRRQEQQK